MQAQPALTQSDGNSSGPRGGVPMGGIPMGGVLGGKWGMVVGKALTGRCLEWSL